MTDFRDEFVNGSGVDPLLYEAAVRIASDVEQGPGGEPEYPIHEALNWKLTRFGQQARPTLQGAMLLQEDGSVWQVKLTDPRQENGKPRKYETPVGAGSRAYLPPIPPAIRQKVASRYGVEVPADGKFWPWVFSQPSIPITLTEGAKKGLSLLSEGIVAIALNGVNGGYRVKDDFGQILSDPELIPDLELAIWEGRKVYLAFDADSKKETVARVEAAISRLAGCFQGASVYRLSWSASQGKGIDDFKVAHTASTVDILFAKAKAFRRKRLTSLQRAVMWAEELDVEYNEMMMSVAIGRRPVALEVLRVELLNHTGAEVSRETFIDAFLAVARRKPYHPVVEYLTSLPLASGDPAQMLREILADLWSVDDRLSLDLGVHWLVAACKRAIEPGCFFKNVLILQSPLQTACKSGFFRILTQGLETPPPEKTWFMDTQLTGNVKDDMLGWHRSWIGELSEFEHVRKRKEESELKSWLSSPCDSLRRPYGHEYEVFPRRFVLCGTTNAQQFLAQDTGTVRYWVVALPSTHTINLQKTAALRDEIWSCAMALYRQGYPCDPSREEMDAYQARNQEFFYESQFAPYLDGYLASRDKVAIPLFQRFLQDQGVNFRVSDQIIADYLRAHGWQRDKGQVTERLSNGEAVRVRYYRKETSCTDPAQTLHRPAQTSNNSVQAGSPDSKELQTTCTDCTDLNGKNQGGVVTQENAGKVGGGVNVGFISVQSVQQPLKPISSNGSGPAQTLHRPAQTSAQTQNNSVQQDPIPTVAELYGLDEYRNGKGGGQ